MKYLITIVLVLFAGVAMGQVTEEWVARYDGTAGDCTDFATAVALDTAGNVYATGKSVCIGGHIYSATVKHDSEGNVLWARLYNGPGNGDDNSADVAVGCEGNVHVTGQSLGWNTLYDYATIKYDSDGNTLWVARYNGSGNGFDFSYAVALDAYGNVYVTGSSLGGGLRNDCVTVKYDRDGNQIWVGRYDGVAHNDDWGEALVVDHRGHIYVTGCSVGSGTSGDYVTIKYDCGGNQLWVARYNGPGNDMDVATALDLDLEGNLYVTGWSYACSTECDIATIKYDSNGNELWVARYNGMTEGDYVARDLAVDASGNIFVTGYFEADSLHTDYATIKYRTDGHQLWVARYNGPGDTNDGACAVAVDEFGGVYVTGGSKGSDANWDYATIKYGKDGNQVWEIRYNGPGDGADVPTALTLDDRGNVYVTGRSLGSGTRYDYATIKYSQPGSLEMNCAVLTPLVCWGKHLYFAVTYINGTGAPLNTIVTFSGYTGHDCDPDSLLVEIPRSRTIPLDSTTHYYHLKVPNSIQPGQYSLSVGFIYSDSLYFCCLDADIVQCEPWRMGENTEWELIELDCPEVVLPTVTSLGQSYPNPFNAATNIAYTVAEPGEVKLTIHNLKGQLIETLVDDYQDAGEYRFTWDASSYSSGLYFYRLTTGDYTETRRMTLLK